MHSKGQSFGVHVFYVYLSDFLFYRQQHSRFSSVLFVPFFACLPAVCKRNTYEQEKQCICNCSCHKIPALWCYAYIGKRNSPPHEYLSEIVRVTAVFPQSVANEWTVAVFLYICRALQYRCQYGYGKEYSRPCIEFRRFDECKCHR